MVSLQLCLIAAAWTSAGDATLLAFTSESCGPCRQMHPVLQRLVEGGYPVRLVDVDREPELARQFGVRPIPCFVLVRDGHEVERVVGLASHDRLVQMWARPASPASTNGSADVGTGHLRAQSPDDRSVPLASLPPAPALPPVTASPSSVPREAPAAEHAMTPLPDQSVRQRALEATVHLRVSDASGQSCGTGTIIDTHGDEALVVTCGHIFRASGGKGSIQVEMFLSHGAPPVPGRLLVYEADNRDVGLVAFRPGVPVRPMPVGSTDYRPQRGEPVFSVGCDHGSPPTVRESQITAIDRYVGPPNLEILGHPVEGRSGGGLFTADGRLIGICNAADLQEDRGIFAGLPSVHYQLKSINQERIYLSQAPSRPSMPTVQAASAGPTIPTVPTAQPADPAMVPLHNVAAGPAGRAEAPADAAEMICIVRVQGATSAHDRLMVIKQPSPALMQLIAQESQAVADQANPLSAPPAATGDRGAPLSTAAAPIVRAQNR